MVSLEDIDCGALCNATVDAVATKRTSPRCSPAPACINNKEVQCNRFHAIDSRASDDVALQEAQEAQVAAAYTTTEVRRTSCGVYCNVEV